MKMKETPEKALQTCSQTSLEHIEDTPSKYVECIIKPPPNIFNLPVEILEKIIGYLHSTYYDYLRQTCRYMEEVINNILKRRLKSLSKKFISQNPISEVSAALRVLKLATEVHVRFGLESIYWQCILQYHNLFDGEFFEFLVPSNVKCFLESFQCMIAKSVGHRCERYNIMRALTILNLIKAFDVSIISTIKRRFLWRTKFEINGIILSKRQDLTFFGMVAERKMDILRILSYILIEIISKKYSGLYHLSEDKYILCKDATRIRENTYITLTICGTERVLKLFSSCLTDGCEHLQRSSIRPNDHLSTAYLDIEFSDIFKRINL